MAEFDIPGCENWTALFRNSSVLKCKAGSTVLNAIERAINGLSKNQKQASSPAPRNQKKSDPYVPFPVLLARFLDTSLRDPAGVVRSGFAFSTTVVQRAMLVPPVHVVCHV